MKNFYYEVVNHPESYFSFKSKARAFGFSECNCPHFSRLQNDRRRQIESTLLENVQNVSPIRLMILGCGELLDTWVLIGKLMQKGFRKIELYLIDPKIDTTAVQKLKRFYRQFVNIELKCWGVHSIYHLDTSLSFHAICAIDYDEVDYPGSMNDLIESFHYLAEKGKLFFDYANSDFVCSRQGLEEILYTDNRPIMEDLAMIIPQNSERLSIFAHRQTLDVLICMLKVLKEKEAEKLDLYYDPQMYDIELHRDFFDMCHPSFHLKLMEERPKDLTPDIVISCFENQLYGEIWRGKAHTVTNYLVSRENIQILRQ